MHVQVFTLGGSFSGSATQDKGGEVYDGSSWEQTASILGSSINSDDPQGMFRTDNYGFFFAWTGGTGEFSLAVVGCTSGHVLLTACIG